MRRDLQGKFSTYVGESIGVGSCSHFNHLQKIAPLAHAMPNIVAPNPLNGGLTAA